MAADGSRLGDAARVLFALVFPSGFICGAGLFLLRHRSVQDALPAVAPFFFWGTVCVGLLLGWRFGRSRLVFSLLLLALGEWILTRTGLGAAERSVLERVIHQSVIVLVPLDLAGLALSRERGILTGHGLWRLGLILVQPLAIGLAWFHARPTLLSALDHPALVGSPLSRAALVVQGTVLLILLVRFLRNQGPLESGFLWAGAAVLAAFATVPEVPSVTAWLAIAALVLTVAFVEESYRMAYRDDLTGVPARRSLNEALLRLGNRYAIAMIDIDHFKKFNDRHGHDVGDQVLRMVATKLERHAGGRTYRYGGEEFTVIFPGKGVDEALPILDEMREEIAGSGFVIRGTDRPRRKPAKTARKTKAPAARRNAKKTASVTISIGVAGPDERAQTPGEVLQRADKALYRAKKGGRNRVCR